MHKKVDVTLHISETETKVYTVERPTADSSASDMFGATDAGIPLLDGYILFQFVRAVAYTGAHSVSNSTAMWPAVLELAMMGK